jgi:hypothetical protein
MNATNNNTRNKLVSDFNFDYVDDEIELENSSNRQELSQDLSK